MFGSYADSVDMYLDEEELRYYMPLKEYLTYCDSLRYMYIHVHHTHTHTHTAPLSCLDTGVLWYMYIFTHAFILACSTASGGLITPVGCSMPS